MEWLSGLSGDQEGLQWPNLHAIMLLSLTGDPELLKHRDVHDVDTQGLTGDAERTGNAR